MPQMQMPGIPQMSQRMQMPGMPQQTQMPQQGQQQQEQPQQPVVAKTSSEPDPFDALTGMKPAVTSQYAPHQANVMPPQMFAAPAPTPAAPQPMFPQASEPKPFAPPTPAANLGPMGFPMPASQPPPHWPATDQHQAMMFDDMKIHAAGDSFSFAPVDSPPPSVSAAQRFNPATGAPMPQVRAPPPASAPAPAATSHYSQDNPFAFI